jgi:hypothetical protein
VDAAPGPRRARHPRRPAGGTPPWCRALIPRALGWTAVPGWRSTSSELTPCRDSRNDAARPTGPPPTISTGTLFMLDFLHERYFAAQGSSAARVFARSLACPAYSARACTRHESPEPCPAFLLSPPDRVAARRRRLAAETFPSRPSPSSCRFPPGGPTDTVGRSSASA